MRASIQILNSSISQSDRDFGNCQLIEHKNLPFTSICLDQGCTNNRLICQICCKTKHSNHKITRINEHGKQPIHLLEVNSKLNDSEQYRKKFQGIQDFVLKVQIYLQKRQNDIYKIVDQQIIFLHKHLWVQFQSMKTSFDNSTIEKLISLLLNMKTAKGQQLNNCKHDLEQYTKIISILNKANDKNLLNPNTLEKIAIYQEHHILQHFTTSFLAIKSILQNMITKIIKECSIFSPDMEFKAFQFYQETKKTDDIISQKEIENTLKKVSKLKNTNLHELKIINQLKSTAINQAIVNELLDIKNLKKLVIRYAQQTPKKSVMQLITTLKNIQQLSLQNCQSFDMQCANTIIKKHPNIKQLHYCLDFDQSFQYFWQVSWFAYRKTRAPLEIQDCYKISQLRELRNIWIKSVDNQLANSIISRLEFLQKLTLGELDKTMRTIHPELFSLLKLKGPKHSLKSLVLLYIDNCQKLKQIFKFNTSLETIVFIYCNNVNEELLSEIVQFCPNLKKLCIHRGENSITGTNLWKMRNLQVLKLTQCEKINYQQAQIGFHNLSNLRFLQLSQNSWVNDQLLHSFANLQNISHLNISHTSITNKGARWIIKLKKLKTLICGMTKIDGSVIANQVAAQCQHISKLNLGGFGSYSEIGKLTDKDLQIISKKLRITHLSLFSCPNITDAGLKGFNYLQCIDIRKTKITNKLIQMFQNNGIEIDFTKK